MRRRRHGQRIPEFLGSGCQAEYRGQCERTATEPPGPPPPCGMPERLVQVQVADVAARTGPAFGPARPAR